MGRNRVVGVLGGMGPAATSDFYAKLVAATPAGRDQDHLPVMIWADPRVPDRSDALLGLGPDPTPMLSTGINSLSAAGADVLAVPCNTAHAFIATLADQADLELVSLIEVTAGHAATHANRSVGLLATRGTVYSRLYHQACSARDVAVITPDEPGQLTVDTAIHTVKAGQVTTAVTEDLAATVGELVAAGASSVVAGCTEVVLALKAIRHLAAPMLDPAQLLAEDVVRRAHGGAGHLTSPY